jgi:hypothetical protein
LREHHNEEEGTVLIFFAALFLFEEGEGILLADLFLELSSSMIGVEANPVTTSNREGEADFRHCR